MSCNDNLPITCVVVDISQYILDGFRNGVWYMCGFHISGQRKEI